MTYTYKTKGTCSVQIQFDINDNPITSAAIFQTNKKDAIL